MAYLVVALGVLIAALGATGVLKPATLMQFATTVWRSRRAVYVAVAIRLAMGALLIVAAPQTGFPMTLRVLGAISIVSGLSVPLVGFERLGVFISWWASRPAGFIRAWALLAVAFGVFLVYAALCPPP